MNKPLTYFGNPYTTREAFSYRSNRPPRPIPDAHFTISDDESTDLLNRNGDVYGIPLGGAASEEEED